MLAEIAYFGTQADAVGPRRGLAQRELRSTLLTFARRRQLLAAIRAAHPEDWRRC